MPRIPAPSEQAYNNRLFAAAIARDYEELDRVIREAASLPRGSKEADSALSYALAHKRSALCQELLERAFENPADPTPGKSQLARAAAGADAATVATLLRFGADPSGLDELGARPLSYVCEDEANDAGPGRFFESLDCLLSAGADPNLLDTLGDSPLGLAAKSLWAEGVERLLAAGADPDGLNGDGLSPLALACERSTSLGFERVALALATAGANPNQPVSRAPSRSGSNRAQELPHNETPLDILARKHASMAAAFGARLTSAYERSALSALPKSGQIRPSARL